MSPPARFWAARWAAAGAADARRALQAGADTAPGALFIEHLDALAEGRVEPGIPTHIPTSDRMLGGGIRPGKQIIVAARPSVGKSSFAQQLCLNLARMGTPARFSRRKWATTS